MAKFPSKSGGGDNTGGVRLPSNTDKAIMTRTEDLLNELEQTLAMSIGNVFLNTKATVTNFAQLKGKAAGKSLLLGGLEDIKNSIENVLSTDNKQYKNTYNLIKRSSESLSKLSSENFLPTVIKNNTVKTIDYTDKFDAVIDAVNSSMDKLINLQGSKTESASADSVKTTAATLDINVSGLDKASLDTMLNLGQLTISKDSMLNANTLHDFSNALASIGSLDINKLPKDVFTYINDSVIPETNRIIEGLSQIDKDIKSKEESIKVVNTFITAIAGLSALDNVNSKKSAQKIEEINTDIFPHIKTMIDELSSITTDISRQYNSIKTVDSFISAIGNLSSIENINSELSAQTLDEIRTYIFPHIRTIINDLSTIDKDISDKYNSINTVYSFIEVIGNLGSIVNVDTDAMRKLLVNIEKNVFVNIVKLIDKLDDISKDISNQYENFVTLNTFFSTLSALNNLAGTTDFAVTKKYLSTLNTSIIPGYASVISSFNSIPELSDKSANNISKLTDLLNTTAMKFSLKNIASMYASLWLLKGGKSSIGIGATLYDIILDINRLDNTPLTQSVFTAVNDLSRLINDIASKLSIKQISAMYAVLFMLANGKFGQYLADIVISLNTNLKGVQLDQNVTNVVTSLSDAISYITKQISFGKVASAYFALTLISGKRNIGKKLADIVNTMNKSLKNTQVDSSIFDYVSQIVNLLDDIKTKLTKEKANDAFAVLKMYSNKNDNIGTYLSLIADEINKTAKEHQIEAGVRMYIDDIAAVIEKVITAFGANIDIVALEGVKNKLSQIHDNSIFSLLSDISKDIKTSKIDSIKKDNISNIDSIVSITSSIIEKFSDKTYPIMLEVVKNNLSQILDNDIFSLLSNIAADINDNVISPIQGNVTTNINDLNGVLSMLAMIDIPSNVYSLGAKLNKLVNDKDNFSTAIKSFVTSLTDVLSECDFDKTIDTISNIINIFHDLETIDNVKHIESVITQLNKLPKLNLDFINDIKGISLDSNTASSVYQIIGILNALSENLETDTLSSLGSALKTLPSKEIANIKTFIDNIKGIEQPDANVFNSIDSVTQIIDTLYKKLSWVKLTLLKRAINALPVYSDKKDEKNELKPLNNFISGLNNLQIPNKQIPNRISIFISSLNTLYNGLKAVNIDNIIKSINKLPNKDKITTTIGSLIDGLNSLSEISKKEIINDVITIINNLTDSFSKINTDFGDILDTLDENNLGGKLDSIVRSFNKVSENNINDYTKPINDIDSIITLIINNLNSKDVNQSISTLSSILNKKDKNVIAEKLKTIINGFSVLETAEIDPSIEGRVKSITDILDIVIYNLDAKKATSAETALSQIKSANMPKTILDILEQFDTLAKPENTKLIEKTKELITGKDGINSLLQIIIETFNNKTIDKSIGNNILKVIKDVEKVIKHINDSFIPSADKINEGTQKLKTSFEGIDVLFAAIQNTGKNTVKTKAALNSIDSTMTDVEKTAVGAEEKGKKAEKAQLSMGTIAKFIMVCGMTMLIGALFMNIPGIVENSIKFGLILGVFIAAVVGTLVLITQAANPKNLEAAANIQGLIITCGIIMLIGALVMMIPGVVENSLKFGITLGLFIAAVLSSIVLYSKIAESAIKDINNLGTLVVTCTIVMMIGALVMMIPGFVKNALEFGLTLAAFETLVLIPALIFKMIGKDALDGIGGLTKLVVACTIVMMIGALFVNLGGGNMIMYALAFGLALAAFESLVIAPFILFKFLAPTVMESLKQFTTCIIVMSTILMIGALVMSMEGGKIVMYALAFGLLLGLFETLVITPFILFKFIASDVMKSLTQFTVCIIVMATILMIGAYIMMENGGEYAKAALAFTGLLMLFELGVIAPVFLFKKIAGEALTGIAQFALFVGVCGAIMIFGPAIFKAMNIGYDEVFLFTCNFSLFVTAMAGIFVAIQKLMQMINNGGGLKGAAAAVVGGNPIKGAKDLTPTNELTQFAITVAILAGVMTMGPVILKTTGITYNQIFAFTQHLSLFVGEMSAIFLLIQWAMNKINGGGLNGSLIKEIIMSNGTTTKSTQKNPLLEFAMTVGILAGVITLGPILLKVIKVSYGEVADFTLALSVFVGVMSGIFVFITKKMGDAKSLATMKEFSTAVAILAGVMIAGPLLIKLAGISYEDIVYFQIALDVFVAAMGVIFTMITKKMGDAKSMVSIISFSAAVAILAGVMIAGPWLIKRTGLDYTDVWKFIGTLVPFVAAMGVVFGLLGKFATKVALGAAVALAMSLGILALSFAISYSCAIIKDYPDALLDLSKIALITIEFGVIFGILGVPALAGFVALGSAVALAISIGILALSYAVSYSCAILKDYPNALSDLQTVVLLAAEFAVLFGVIGIPTLAGLISLGSVAMLAASIAMATFATAVNISCGMISDWPNALSDLQTVALLAGEFAAIFGIIGIPPVALLVALGSTVLTSVAETMITFDTAIGRLSSTFKKHGGTTTVEAYMDSFKKIVTEVTDVLASDIAGPILWLKIKSAKANLNAISEALQVYGVAMDKLAIGIQKIQEVKNFSGDMLYNYSGKIIVDFTQAIPNDMKDYVNKMSTLSWFAGQASLTIRRIGNAIADIANLKIAQEWDSKGNPTKYRNLSDKDFKMAITNVSQIVTNMASAIKNAAADLKSYNWNELNKTLNSSKEMGAVIGSIGEGVGKMAQLQVPIEWNDGKPTAYRTLKAKDFTAASLGVSQIITTLGIGIMQAYQMGATLGNGKNIFDETYNVYTGEKQSSPFARTISASMQLGELIGSAAEGVSKMANMQVPEIGSWDSKEKRFAKYKTLGKKDFENAASNTNIILSTLGKAIIDTYNTNPSLYNDVITCTKKGGLFSSDEYSSSPSPMVKAIGANTQLVKLISEAANAVSKMAALMIPDDWNNKGQAIHYKQLINEDFKKAATNTETIITTMAAAVKKTYTDNKSLFDNKNFDTIIKHTNEMTGVIGKVADVLIKIAKAQVPVYKNGKLDHYEAIDVNAATIAMKVNLKTIIKGMCETFKDAAAILTQQFGDLSVVDTFSSDPAKIQTNKSSLAQVIKGVSGMAKVFANVSNTMIKLAKAQVPVYKGGRLDHYKPINIAATVSAMKVNFKDIVIGMIEAITNKEVIKALDDITKDEGKLDIITSSISKIANTVGKVAKIISDLANMKVATGYDKEGKAKGYKAFLEGGFDTVKTQLQSFLSGDKNIFKLLIDPVNELKTDTYKILWDKNEVENLERICENVSNVVNLIASSAKSIVDLANGKIATGYDKDGKAKGYTTLLEGGYKDVKDKMDEFLNKDSNIFSLLCNSAKSIIETVDGIDITQIDNIDNVVSSIIDVFTNAIESINDILEEKETINNILGYKSVIQDNNKTGNALFNDLTSIITSFKTLGNSILQDADAYKDIASITQQAINIQMYYSLLSGLLINLMSNMTNVSIVYNGHKSHLLNINNEETVKNISNVIKNVNTIKSELMKQIQSENDDEGNKKTKFNEKIVNNFINEIISTNKTLNTLFNAVSNIYANFNNSSITEFNNAKLLDKNIGAINAVISDIDSFITKCIKIDNVNEHIKKLSDLEKVINSLHKFIFGGSNSIGFVAAVGKITESINNLVTNVIQEPETADYLSSRLKPVVTDIIESTSILDTLRNSVTAISVADVIGETGEALNVLANGLTDVLTAIQGAQVKPQFKQNINELKAFIKESVNTLDSDKASQLTNLILALNAFMEKTGDIQGLTEAITNDLTVALDKITQKLDESNKAYELTERLQKSRHALIDSSIKKISSIMNKEIIVKVTAEMPPTQDLGGTPGEAVDKQGGTTPAASLNAGGNGGNGGNPSGNNVKVTRGADQNNGNGNGGTDYASANTLSRIDKKVDKIMSGLHLS